MKICMVTGGSGGHIYPALTFADYVKENRNYEIFFIGNDHKMEATIIPQAGYEFYAIHNHGLQGSVFDKIKALFGQFSAILEARKHLKRLKPDVVFSFGGYVTLPVVLAAKSLGIDIVIHEQNAFVGKANRVASRYAKVLFTCYEEAFSDDDRTFLFGNPRAALADKVDVNRDEFDRIGLNQNLKTVLCVMGSQGSQTMNEVFKEMIKLYEDPKYQIVFVTGKNDYETFINEINELPNNVYVEGFVDQGNLLPFVDLIVARAGASTITEIVAFDLPSILIPSPYVADNHQFHNASALSSKNAAILYEEKDVNAQGLIDKIESVVNDSNYCETLTLNLKSFKTPNVNGNILEKIEDIVDVT